MAAANDAHVWPIDEPDAHEESIACWCVPRLRPVKGSTAYVVVHQHSGGRTSDVEVEDFVMLIKENAACGWSR